MPSKRPIQELREIHFGDPKWAFWKDFPWQMRIAKVDMLGTRDVSIMRDSLPTFHSASVIGLDCAQKQCLSAIMLDTTATPQ